MSTERLGANKAFTNKLWNAGKFVLQNLPSQSDLTAWEAINDFRVRHLSVEVHTIMLLTTLAKGFVLLINSHMYQYVS